RSPRGPTTTGAQRRIRTGLRPRPGTGRALHRPGGHAQPPGHDGRDVPRPHPPEDHLQRRPGDGLPRPQGRPVIVTLALKLILEPMPLDDYWLLLLLPLTIAVAVIYKANKIDNLAHLPRQATYLAAQIILF